MHALKEKKRKKQVCFKKVQENPKFSSWPGTTDILGRKARKQKVKERSKRKRNQQNYTGYNFKGN